jgi:thioredoxin-related protein
MKPACWLVTLPAALLMASCGLTKKDTPETTQSPFGPTGIPPHLRGGMEEAGTPVKPGSNQPDMSKVTHTDADLAWTDADNANAGIPELNQVWSNASTGTRWLESETEAKRESKKSGKPLLIWFNDDAIAASKTVNDQLLRKPEFESWATENTVRLVIEARPKGSSPDQIVRREFHNRDLKKKYNARGYPTFIVLAPSGEVIGRYTGYRRGKEDFIWGQMKQGVSIAAEKQEAWRSSLEKKGYREWSDGKGRSIFAKLVAYKDGQLLLAEPDGNRARTKEQNLCSADREWIKQQKAVRGIQ